MAERLGELREPGKDVSREILIAIILAFLESPRVTDSIWRPGLFAISKSRLAGTRIETLCRRLIASYAPAKAPSFSAPAPGEDSVAHTTRENDLAYQAFEARSRFKAAFERICDSDEIFRLTPREALMDLLELRQLLQSFPEGRG